MNRTKCLDVMSVLMFLLAVSGEGGSPPTSVQGDQPEAGVGNTTTGIGPFTRPRFRALWELGFMVRCTTGRGLLTAIYDYAWYGCYCGLGGEGEPVDGVDRCCMLHDHCYDVAFRTRECPFEPDEYFIPYRGHYSMSGCRTSRPVVICDPPSSYPWWHPYPTCAAAICHCDAAVSMCLGRNTFHPRNAWYYKRACRHEPLVTLETTAMTVEDTTTMYPFESTFAPGTASELPDDVNWDIMTASPDNNSDEGSRYRPINEDQIRDESARAFSESRRRQKMTQYKREKWPNYFKKHP